MKKTITAIIIILLTSSAYALEVNQCKASLSDVKRARRACPDFRIFTNSGTCLTRLCTSKNKPNYYLIGCNVRYLCSRRGNTSNYICRY